MHKHLGKLGFMLALGCLLAACSPQSVELSAPEQAWVDTHTVRLAPDPSWPPIEFIDQSGRYQGLAADYLALIAERTGLKIKLVRLESWDQIVRSAQAGKIDLMVGIYTGERATRHAFTESFIAIPNVIVVNTQRSAPVNLNSLEKVLIIKGHAIETYLRSNYPKLRIEYTQNTSAGLRAVSFNKTAVFVIDLPSASYQMDREGIANLKLAGELDFSYELHLICNKNEPLLRDILEKGLASISPQEKHRIWRKWVSLERSTAALYRRMLLITSTVIILALLLSLTIMLWNRLLRRQVNERTRELNESRTSLSLALKGANLTTWDIWPDTASITFSVDADLSPTRISIETWHARIHPADLELVDKQLQAHLANLSNNYECEYRLIGTDEQWQNNDFDRLLQDHDQQWRWMRARGRITERHADGSPRRISGILLDITRHRQAEETNHLLAQVIEQTVEGVAITDPDYRIEYVNPALERTLDYSHSELNQQDFLSLLQDRSSKQRQINQKLSQASLFHGRLILHRKTKGQIIAEAIISPLIDTRGQAGKYIMVLRDVTHELELERQLQQAQKMEALGTLAGGIAHDFNNILTPIIGYSEICRDEGVSPTQNEYLEEILKAATRARDMISHIQVFSRQSSQEIKPIRLQPVISEALKLIRASVPSSIIIESDISPDCGPVLANPTQVHQIVMNLCTNAYHAMEDGGGNLRISLMRIPDTAENYRTSVRLRVSDTGQGIEPEIIERIFDPYFTTKDIGKGSGMGLAVVHGIVERSGGRINVESTPGQGTIFEIDLPESEIEPDSAESSAAREPRGQERILLVDDEPAIARLIKQMLIRLGYTVTAATSGPEALELFEQNPKAFDLLVTDMAMPGMTGTELIKNIHAVRPGLPVIVCSGYSEDHDLNTSQDSAIKAIVMKPVIRQDLADALRRALD